MRSRTYHDDVSPPSSSPGIPRWAVSIPDIHQLPYTPLGFPGLPGEVVKIGNVKAGFVALRILSDQTRSIGKLVRGNGYFEVPYCSTKSRSSLALNASRPPDQVDDSRHIMLNAERVKPGIDFREVIPPSLPAA